MLIGREGERRGKGEGKESKAKERRVDPENTDK